MLGRLGKGDIAAINVDRRADLRIFHFKFLARWAKCEELSFLRNESHIVALAVFEGKEEKIVKTVDVIGEEGTVIGLTNCGDCSSTKMNAEVGELGHVELVVVGELLPSYL